MNDKIHYFRNKNQIDTIKPNSLWLLEGDYMVPHDYNQRITIYYESHEDWFYEVKNPNSKIIRSNS
ncbi:MAG: hypothetical protein QM503_00145 [Bacteroidota bacterium]